MAGRDGEGVKHQQSSGSPEERGRCFRVVTEAFPDRVEVRVEEQEWVENFGWINCPNPSPFPRFRIVLHPKASSLTRAAWLVTPNRPAAEARFRHRYQRRLEDALVAAQMEANRRNAERHLISKHMETVREVLNPEDR